VTCEQSHIAEIAGAQRREMMARCVCEFCKEDKMKMNNVIKGMLIALILIYAISPVDAFPGPVDDIIVILLGLAAQKRVGRINN
jgi:uncharacterized membrane protein YkvA (DUF1232 family)